MFTDRDLIRRQMGDPALVRLSHALDRLTSTITFMSVGAHPDDEHSGLLAALRYRFGMRVVVLCSTRGEGGQNAIGPERGGALGVVRTREMEEAARALDATVAWVGHGPDDRVFDFGFSKNADDTLARWGEATIVERVVEAYRRFRPDIVEVTFLDVPGQHGHHRAMTRAALTAFDRAADPTAHPQQVAAGLDPWQVGKLYLPAWSGAGSSYDDEEPPPDATVTVSAPGRDRATGATYAQIGEWSRFHHATQGMGRWRDRGPDRWPLHLAKPARRVNIEDDIRDALPATIGALALEPGVPPKMARALADAQTAIDQAVAGFPHPKAITAAALRASAAMDAARATCPAELAPRVAHRLARKTIELDAVLFEAAGILVRAVAKSPSVAPGESGEVAVSVTADDPATKFSVALAAREGISVGAEEKRGEGRLFPLTVDQGASHTNPYPATFDPLARNGEVAVTVSAIIDGRTVRRVVDTEEPLRILPAVSVALDPDALIVNLARPASPIGIAALKSGDPSATLALAPPRQWTVEGTLDGFILTPPTTLAPGRFSTAVSVDGRPASRVRSATYAHLGTSEWAEPLQLPGLAVDAALPDGARVAYAGGGNDRVDFWLRQLGVDVTALDAEMLEHGDLKRFTTIVVGIFAFGKRGDLGAARGRLRRWVEAGGHLVSLYHRPSDGWSPDETPPRFLEIGLPSLRWRVTDPAAPVTVLIPGHPLLMRPNVIGAADWEGWDKERGLYFASRWDDVYQPLIAMSDAGEAPLKGALLSGAIGKGRHTHTSLVLHHQLDRLVPGAFRLMANMLQPAWSE
jgi:LmbE family N-acetylglucosaminyl deacetylase